MNKIMISCDEATTISDKNQYREASFGERLIMSFHLMMCKNCKIYDEQNAVITQVIENKVKEDGPIEKKLTDKDKKKIKKKIKQ